MSKVKKVKKKTHKGLKKVLNVRQSGSITKSNGGVNHNTGKNNTKTNRKRRAGSELSKSDYVRFKELI